MFRHFTATVDRSLKAFSLGLLWIGLLPLAGQAEEAAPVSQLKAAYLYNFTQFIEWPEAAFESEDDNFSLCVLGKNGVLDALQGVTHYKYRQRGFDIIQIDDIKQSLQCQLVYLDTDQTSYQQYLATHGPVSLLTVGSGTDFVQRGGMIGLIQVGENLRFEVNRDALLKAGLTPRATLLEVAERVIGTSADQR